ncbi:MAG TPA: Rieske (2Fe-2S) protein [Gemmatimonadaceae bacterium]|jgi:Rieske Fe-S protein
MSCKDCLNRRDFLAKSALAAALVALEGCGDGQIGPTATNLGTGLTIKIADFPGLATAGTVVDIGHVRAVVRTGDSSFLALSRVCTHEGCEADVEQNQIRCPCHHSVFSATGDVVRGPDGGGSIGPLVRLNSIYDALAGTLTIS